MKLTREYLATLSPTQKQEEILLELDRCIDDPIYCIETYFTVLEPKGSKRVPFKLYPHQRRAIKGFRTRKRNITMKSRQMGLTAISTAFQAYIMCTMEDQVSVALANKLKTSRKFLKMVRDLLDDARTNYPWLVADYVYNNNGKDSFSLKTGCILTAESNNEDACRGDTINWLFIDEVAAIDRENATRMSEIWAAAGITLTRSGGTCIAVSTPKGTSGWYYDQYTNALKNGWNVIDAHWTEHPIYSQGQYQYVQDINDPLKGTVKFYNEEWPEAITQEDKEKYKTRETYEFVQDGKMRSPWYDAESRVLGPRLTKCELDCSFVGSGGEVIDSEILRDLGIIQRANPSINQPGTGLWKSYKVYKEYDPLHRYLLCADAATGDGSDYSAFLVIDLDTLETVASFKEKLDGFVYARIINEVGKQFGKCMVIVERQGPGETTLLELKNNLRYPNIYHHKLSKTDILKNQKTKLGFWQGANTRLLGGNHLEKVINNGQFKIYSEDLLSELHTWIWDTDGKRRHAPGKNDDIIMAAQLGMFFIFEVLPKMARNKLMMETQFSVERNGYQPGVMLDREFDMGM